jgi:twinkle protein
MERGIVVDKKQCPSCAESGTDSAHDNLVTFESGVQYCVAGHGTMGKNPICHELPHKTLQNNTEREEKGLIQGETPKSSLRGISAKTMEYYGYQINREKKCHISNYYDNTGKVVMQQLRDEDKKFPLLGDKSYKKMLYGMWKHTPDERVFITITEGQIDCLSIAEAFDCKYPVVSLPQGAGCAADVLMENAKYLNGFKYIVLAFDSDKPGQEATQACLKLFEPGKIRVAKLPRKDANEMLQEGEAAEIRKCIYGAVEYIPAPILTGQALLDTLKGYEQKTRKWPWSAANNVINPIFIPGVYTLAAWPGVGKTIVVADIMRSVIKEGGKIGVISLEESTPKLLLKLAAMISGVNLRDIRDRALTDAEIEMARSTADSIVTFDHKTYGSDLLTILENLPYIAQALKCEFIIFDNLSFAATNLADDERRGIDKAMLQLKDSSTKYNYVLFNICHLNDDSDDFKQCSIRGSRAVHMYSDYEIYLGREVESQETSERNTLEFFVKKDRETGEDTGKSFKLRYDTKNKKFLDFF